MADTNTNAVAKKSFFSGVKSEFKKITWPKKDTLAKETAAVVIISVLMGGLIALLDAIIKFGIDKIIV